MPRGLVPQQVIFAFELLETAFDVAVEGPNVVVKGLDVALQLVLFGKDLVTVGAAV